jgi:anti-sigma factor ChrR (cupin superfamily)
MPPVTVIPHLDQLADHPDRLPWQPFRPGIEIYPLYPAQPNGVAAALLRYQPGAQVPTHHHPDFEHILVISGSQSDENGTYPAGTLVINPPHSYHHVTSPDGCIVLVIWTKPVQFTPQKTP